MVRTTDRDARRRLLADAVWTLIRGGGLEAASVRAVAARSGLSAGSVRHVFASQDELHVFAMEELLRTTGERVRERLDPVSAATTGGCPDQARARVEAALVELLPTTAESSRAFQAHLQFITRAVVHPPLADTAGRSHRALQDLYEQCLAHLVRAGAAAPDLDVPDAARALAVVMDGLVLRRLTAPDLLSTAQMTGLLRRCLDSLCGTPGGAVRP